MADISAAMVKELRERTGLGMMECKKALVESAGDIEKAIEELRKSSGMKAAKKAGRTAADGVIAAKVAADGSYAVVAEVNSETDFVARDSNFLEFVGKVLDKAFATKLTDVAALMEGELETARQALVQKIGENISVRRLRLSAAAAGVVSSYVHSTNKIGVLVNLKGGDAELARDGAMHVAASNPQVVRGEDMPADVIAKEKEIYTAQAAESGKPADIVAKMVEGRVNKYLAEVTLLGQPFVKNPDETVEKHLKAKGATVRAFTLYVVGEGIEKRKDDFAAEVAAMAKA